MTENNYIFSDTETLQEAIYNYLEENNSDGYPEIGEWDVSEITDMSNLFEGMITTEEKNERIAGISNWNVSKVTDISNIFSDCSSFNQPLDGWEFDELTTMNGAFSGCSSFNQPLENWNVYFIESFIWVFEGCSSFNQPLNGWTVSNALFMSSMFKGCSSFNQPLDGWDVSKVTDMRSMFEGCSSFNQPLDDWDVSKVSIMSSMFKGCSSFNEPLDRWDVREVTDMRSMFEGCSSFNQPLDRWGNNVLKVKNMSSMFEGCSSFLQDLSNWDLQNIHSVTENTDRMFLHTPMSNNISLLPDGVTPIPTTNPPPQEGQQLTRFNRENVVNSVPLAVNNNVPSILGIEAFDVIEGTNMPVREQLEASRDASLDDKPIFILQDRRVTVISRSMITQIFQVNEGSATRYICRVVGSMNINNINVETPYLSLRNFGPIEGIAPISQIKYILEHPEITAVQLVQNGRADATASLQTIRLNEFLQIDPDDPERRVNYVAAAHCQAGMPEIIYELVDISSSVSATSRGRKRKVGTKKNKKRTRRNGRKKSSQKKINRKNNKTKKRKSTSRKY
jgi:surface protein